VVTAVIAAKGGAGSSPQAVLEGFHAGIYVSLGAALLGVSAMLLQRTRRTEDVVVGDELLDEALEEAA
jgi:hypothetical protein